MKRFVPATLTIAGSDNSGGAGIQADLKTFTHLGVYGTSAITCVVAEHPGKVKSIHPVPPARVREQIDLVFEAFPVRAAKTGMLYSGSIIRECVRALSRKRIPLVVDPVMVATSGAVLMKPAAIRLLQEELIPAAQLVTPNLDEAALLLGIPIRSLDEVREAARELTRRFGVPFLVKGGHLRLKRSVDVLCDGKKMWTFSAPTVRNVQTHGTGCTYSAAITAALALGHDLPSSVRIGKRFITRAIRHHLQLGRYQPLNHLP